MATLCCCGNATSRHPDFKVTISPCTCAEPRGPRRTLRLLSQLPDSPKQYEERKRVGLPLETPAEKSVRTRWV